MSSRELSRFMKLMICFDIKASLDIAPAELFPVNRTEELLSAQPYSVAPFLATRGKDSVKVVPFPGSLSTQMEPPFCLRMS